MNRENDDFNLTSSISLAVGFSLPPPTSPIWLARILARSCSDEDDPSDGGRVDEVEEASATEKTHKFQIILRLQKPEQSISSVILRLLP